MAGSTVMTKLFISLVLLGSQAVVAVRVGDDDVIQAEPQRRKPKAEDNWKLVAGDEIRGLKDTQIAGVGGAKDSPKVPNPVPPAAGNVGEVKPIANPGGPIAKAAAAGDTKKGATGDGPTAGEIFGKLTDFELEDDGELDDTAEAEDDKLIADGEKAEEEEKAAKQAMEQAKMAHLQTPEGKEQVQMDQLMKEKRGKSDQLEIQNRALKKRLIKNQAVIADGPSTTEAKGDAFREAKGKDKKVVVDAMFKIDAVMNVSKQIEGAEEAFGAVTAFLSAVSGMGLRSPDTCSKLEEMQADLATFIPAITKAMADARTSAMDASLLEVFNGSLPVGAAMTLGVPGEPNDRHTAQLATDFAQRSRDAAEAAKKADLNKNLPPPETKEVTKDRQEDLDAALSASKLLPPEPDYGAKVPPVKQAPEDTDLPSDEFMDNIDMSEQTKLPVTKTVVENLNKQAAIKMQEKEDASKAAKSEADDTGVDIEKEIALAKRGEPGEPDLELVPDLERPEDVAAKMGAGKSEAVGIRKQASQAMLSLLKIIWQAGCKLPAVQYLKSAFKVLPSIKTIKATENARAGKYGNMSPVAKSSGGRAFKARQAQINSKKKSKKAAKQMKLAALKSANARLTTAKGEIEDAGNELDHANDKEDAAAAERAKKKLSQKTKAMAKAKDLVAHATKENQAPVKVNTPELPIQDAGKVNSHKEQKAEGEKERAYAEDMIENLTHPAPDQKEIAKAKAAGLDCNSELEVWNRAWSPVKKELCCGHSVLCQENKKEQVLYKDGKEIPKKPEPNTSDWIKEHGLNCMAEKPVFKFAWSEEKIEHCCKGGKVDCQDPEEILKNGEMPNKTSTDGQSRLPQKRVEAPDETGDTVGGEVYQQQDASFENKDVDDEGAGKSGGKGQKLDLKKQTGVGSHIDYVNSSGVVSQNCVGPTTKTACEAKAGCEWHDETLKKIAGNGACRPRLTKNKSEADGSKGDNPSSADTQVIGKDP